MLTATGGGERHPDRRASTAAAVWLLRAFTLPTAVYATEKDFTDGVLHSQAILKRAAQAVERGRPRAGQPPAARIAAE